MLNQVYFWDF